MVEDFVSVTFSTRRVVICIRTNDARICANSRCSYYASKPMMNLFG